MARHVAERRGASLGTRLLGVLGELLITAGIIVGLFVFWQLYWTSWQVAGPAAERADEFSAANPPATATAGEHRTDDPPAVETPAYGEQFGTLHVPKWDFMSIPIVEGVGSEILDLGNAGHYPETALPGEVGNFSLAGHRRTYGNNFRQVDILEPGDELIVETADAYIVYVMEYSEIVLPDQVEVIAAVPGEPGATPTERYLTLTTCHPEYGNTHRFIVHAKFSYWVDKADGMPEALLETAN